MKQEKLSVVKLEPSARFNLGVSGTLQAMVAATAISLGTTYVPSILFMILGGVGLAYIALAVAGRLPVFPLQDRNDRSN
jgi:hypothetical protein